MQAGVDVAIATKLLIRFHEGVRSVTLLTGDGDFSTAVQCVTSISTKRVPVFIVSFKKALSPKLQQFVGQPNVLFLDDVWAALELKAEEKVETISVNSSNMKIVLTKDTPKKKSLPNTVYVSKIANTLSEGQVKALFESRVGVVTHCKVLPDSKTQTQFAARERLCFCCCLHGCCQPSPQADHISTQPGQKAH